MRFYLFGYCGRARIFWSDASFFSIFDDCLSWVCDCSRCEGSILKICRFRHHHTDSCTDVHQCWSEPQCSTTYLSHLAICELWRFISDLTPDCDRNFAQYFSLCRVPSQCNAWIFFTAEKKESITKISIIDGDFSNNKKIIARQYPDVRQHRWCIHRFRMLLAS